MISITTKRDLQSTNLIGNKHHTAAGCLHICRAMHQDEVQCNMLELVGAVRRTLGGKNNSKSISSLALRIGV